MEITNNMYWIEVLSNFKEICFILCVLSFLPLIAFGTLITCEKHDLFKERVKGEKAMIRLDPWVLKSFNLNWIITGTLLLICIFVPSKNQILEIYGAGEVIEHLKHGDIENLSEESIIYFERWAADSMEK